MRPLPSLSLAAVLWAAAALALAPAPVAAKVPCVPGEKKPRCHVWQGKVELVADGDTLDVDLAGDGTRQRKRVRITGINATELTRYSRTPQGRRGECHAVEAANRLHTLVRRSGNRVRLTAQRPSSRSGKRLRRSVAVRDRGRWRDVGTRLVEEGHALWLPGHVEDHFNRRYAKLAQRARLEQRNLYDPRSCGTGPSPHAQLRLWVNWDADSADGKNLNDEFIRIKNDDLANPVRVGRWIVRDSDLRRYRLPRNAEIAPGGTLTVRVGSGRDSATDLHWGLRAPAFENVARGARMGDGAYLFDPRGNLRASMIYPCVVACGDPLQGRIQVSADPGANPETLSVRNVGDLVVDLEGYVLRSYPRSYHFPGGTLIPPGDTLRVVVGGSPRANAPLRKHWPVNGPILKNKGASVRVETYDATVIDCHAWRRGSC